MPLIQIFKAGDHTDSKGNKKTWTEADLKAIAEKYNNQSPASRHDAPLRPGDHEEFQDENGNKLIKPALGWVKKLKAEGANLFADVLPTPALIKNVKDNYYKKVSMAVKDGLLDHIAILGAKNPAVKGMADMAFSEEEKSELESYKWSTEELTQLLEFQKMESNSTTAGDPGEDPPSNNQTEGGDPSKPGVAADTTATSGENNNSYSNTENNPELITNEEFTDMDQKFRDNLRELLAKETSPEVAAKFDKAWATALSQYKPEPEKKDNSSEHTEPKVPSFEETDLYKQQLKRIKDLEAKDRRNEFAQFVSSQKGITAGMKPLALEALEISHRSANPQEFTEEYSFTAGDKKLSPVDVVKSLLSAIPDTTEGLRGEFTKQVNETDDINEEVKGINEFVEAYEKEDN